MQKIVKKWKIKIKKNNIIAMIFSSFNWIIPVIEW